MLTVVTGGSGSGKSEYAEKLVMETGISPRVYVATMRVWDEEGQLRVARHRKMRAEKGFETVEHYQELEKIIVPDSAAVLLECMSNLAANEQYRLGKSAADSVIEGIKRLEKSCRHLVVVTNEVFSDGESYNPETVEYMEILGKINRYLGQAASSATEVVYGIPIQIK